VHQNHDYQPKTLEFGIAFSLTDQRQTMQIVIGTNTLAAVIIPSPISSSLWNREGKQVWSSLSCTSFSASEPSISALIVATKCPVRFMWCSVFQCVQVYWSVLQWVAVCCSVLQCVEQTKFRRLLWQRSARSDLCVAVCFSVFKCTTVCCSVLQCVAVCCSVLKRQNFGAYCGNELLDQIHATSLPRCRNIRFLTTGWQYMDICMYTHTHTQTHRHTHTHANKHTTNVTDANMIVLQGGQDASDALSS